MSPQGEGAAPPSGVRSRASDFERARGLGQNLGAAPERAALGVTTGRAGIQDGMSVLDLGCGEGQVMRALAAAGAEPIGLDLNPALAAAARPAGTFSRIGGAWASAWDKVILTRFSLASHRSRP